MAFQKRRGDEKSTVCSIDKWRMPPFRAICSESRKSCVQLGEVYPDIDCSFWIKAARKAFRKFPKCDSLEEHEATVLALICFDVVISDCVITFETELLISECFINSEEGQFKLRKV